MKRFINVILAFIFAFTLAGCQKQEKIVISITKPSSLFDPFGEECYSILFSADYEQITMKDIENRIVHVSDNFIGLNMYSYEYHSMMSHHDIENNTSKEMEKHVYSFTDSRSIPRIYEHNILESHIPHDRRDEIIEAYFDDMVYYEKRILNGYLSKTKQTIDYIPSYCKSTHRAHKIEAIISGKVPDVESYNLEMAKKNGCTYIHFSYLQERDNSIPKIDAYHDWIYVFNENYDTIRFFHSENTHYLDENNETTQYITYQEICYPFNRGFDLPDLSDYEDITPID